MKLWTYKHFISYVPSLAFMAVIAGILRKFLLKKDEKTRLIPFQVLAIVLFGLEVGKQIVSLKMGYDLYHLPFYFCSMFIFLIPLSAFYSGKWRKHILSFTTVICATLFLFMLIAPAYTYSEESIASMFSDFMEFHKVAFHNVVIFEFLLILSLNLYEPNTKFDLKTTLIAIPIYCLIGGSMAQIFKVNFNNFYSCAAEFVDNARLAMIENIGHAAGQTVYVIGVSIVTLAFSVLSYFAYRLIYKFVKIYKK